MGVNKYKAHVWVVPEDDANRQLANGFLLHPALNDTCIEIRPASGGWLRVLQEFVSDHVSDLRKYPLRHLVLLIDFDEKVETRTERFRNEFPDDVSGRVYVLGTRDEPEPLRRALGQSLERIGEALAGSCADGNPELWNHELLNHNQAELDRLTENVKPILFSPPAGS